MTDVEVEARSKQRRIRSARQLIAGGALTFVLFAAIGAAVLLFAWLTVHARPEAELHANLGSIRSFNTITWWNDNGYLASGGLISLKQADNTRVFYRSSTGGYMVSGYVVEKLAMMITGKYNWKLLALHNQLLMVVTSALLALLVFRILIGLRLARHEAFLFAAATQIVFVTFPDLLAQYWELYPQAAALPFALLFLLLDEDTSRRSVRFAQGAAAFLLVYFESLFGLLFLVVYGAFVYLAGSREPVKRVLLRTLVPAAAAFLFFYLQLTVARMRFPNMPFQGSELMFRTGLDGSTQYYRDHFDIIFGRDIARANFPVNREYLFKWPTLFIAGAVAAAAVIIAAAGRDRLRPMALTLIPLIGAYVLYGALFSQAFVIHPYLYDILLATPLMIALFGFAPGLAEERWRSGGVIVLVTLFAAAWYAMVQLRHYAMWFPVPRPEISESFMRTHAGRPVA